MSKCESERADARNARRLGQQGGQVEFRLMDSEGIQGREEMEV